jgi:hypothetical protein
MEERIRTVNSYDLQLPTPCLFFSLSLYLLFLVSKDLPHPTLELRNGVSGKVR